MSTWNLTQHISYDVGGKRIGLRSKGVAQGEGMTTRRIPLGSNRKIDIGNLDLGGNFRAG